MAPRSSDISDEQVLRYMVKKAQKKALRVADKLSQDFVWKKKIEREITTRGQPLDVSLKAERKRHQERMEEIQRLKKRRREQPLAAAAAAAEVADREKRALDEDEFDYKQSLLRSRIRLREGRMKPIDILSSYILDDCEAEHLGVQVEPCMVFKGLTLEALKEVHDEIKLRLAWDRATQNHVQFWKAVMVICDWELGNARKKRDVMVNGLHSFITVDVESELDRKSSTELETIQTLIESNMSSGKAKVIEYWEAVLESLPFYKARAYLKEMHTSNMRPVETTEESGTSDKDTSTITSSLVNIEEDSETDHKDDEYRLKVPKYSYYVRTGFEWNKYSRLHYDMDNPPPKIVKGYKIVIHYPDLTKVPTYTIEKDGSEDGETCLLRFHAGPPYEDVTFTIVNKELDYSHKNGFKCTFENGILQLYFNFRRYYYRR